MRIKSWHGDRSDRSTPVQTQHFADLARNRTLLGILLEIALSLADVLLTVFGNRAERTPERFWRAFTSRFAIGFLAPHVSMRVPPVLSGALVGLLIRLPDAFASKSYAGILGTGVVFCGMAGLAVEDWAHDGQRIYSFHNLGAGDRLRLMT